jgi:hypothetical protein
MNGGVDYVRALEMLPLPVKRHEKEAAEHEKHQL